MKTQVKFSMYLLFSILLNSYGYAKDPEQIRNPEIERIKSIIDFNRERYKKIVIDSLYNFLRDEKWTSFKYEIDSFGIKESNIKTLVDSNKFKSCDISIFYKPILFLSSKIENYQIGEDIAQYIIFDSTKIYCRAYIFCNGELIANTFYNTTNLGPKQITYYYDETLQNNMPEDFKYFKKINRTIGFGIENLIGDGYCFIEENKILFALSYDPNKFEELNEYILANYTIDEIRCLFKEMPYRPDPYDIFKKH